MDSMTWRGSCPEWKKLLESLEDCKSKAENKEESVRKLLHDLGEKLISLSTGRSSREEEGQIWKTLGGKKSFLGIDQILKMRERDMSRLILGVLEPVRHRPLEEKTTFGRLSMALNLNNLSLRWLSIIQVKMLSR